MKILIVNPIMYSCENKREVPKVKSVKDTLLCNLCQTFTERGHQITLYTTNIYKPIEDEQYEYDIIWDQPVQKNIFLPACFPKLKNLRTYLMCNEFDFVISSEVFQWSSLVCSILLPKKTVIWHETARHNYILKTLPSRFWYNIIVPIFFRKTLVIPRSLEAKSFIEKYAKRVSDIIVEHGVNEHLFIPNEQKEDYFIVVSQLIPRKHVEQIIQKFSQFINTYEKFKHYKIIICGEGINEYNLKDMSYQLGCAKSVEFKGKIEHSKLVPILSKARALLINSEKENSMISIIESIAVGTPIITTSAPLNSSYIRQFNLGIVNNDWNKESLAEIIRNGDQYIKNCIDYRGNLLNSSKVDDFISVYNKFIKNRAKK